MNQYQMTESEKELFLSGDEGRGKIRQEAALSNPEADSIQIVDSEGSLFDTVSGTVSGTEHDAEKTEPGLAVVLTDEQLDERRTVQALEAADLARTEEELKPLVMSKLRDEARDEIREEYRETIQRLRQEKAELQSQVRRLTEGVNSLSRRETALTDELAMLKARSQP